MESPEVYDKVISSFKNDFFSIREKGFVPSNRSHNTGIGKTFEDLVGVNENNNKLADYHDILELKSARELSQSMITLFTIKPTHPPNANTYLRDTYGHPDLEYPDIKTLHTTISALKFNTYKNKYGFKLEVDDKTEKLFMRVINLETDTTESKDIYNTYEELKHSFEKKCKYIAYISAETKKENGTEFFKFKNAFLLTGLTFDNFIEHIKNGLIVYDIRIGAYKSGKSIGKPHDHGSGIRIRKNFINTVFDVEEL
ncbi:MAG: MvaI/BcnI restriction endonuclease family protein [Methanosarcinaceae archaeon]|nr:MvaI/BcnI restriction endonuclease family protein [Methanosarcinaceae archaeon]